MSSEIAAAANRTTKQSRGKTFLQNFTPAIALSLAISFLIALYAPLELYFTNKSEFLFNVQLLLPKLLILFVLLLAVLLVGFALCRLIFKGLYDVILTFAGIGYICTYVQGMFMVGNLPPLDGSPIDWSNYTSESIASVILWIVVGLLIVLLIRFLHMERVYKVFIGVSAFLSAVLLVTLVSVCVMNNGLAQKHEAVTTKAEEFTMSTDQNLVILIVDAADSATFNNLMETTDPEFRDVFEDFTYYPNTVCAYSFTRESIPFILTGQWYENQTSFEEFTTDAMDNSPLLTTLKDNDYRMGMYEADLLYDSDNVYEFENVEDTGYKFKSTKSILIPELRLVFFKYAPFPLKRFANVNMSTFNLALEPASGSEGFVADNANVYEDFKNDEVTLTDQKCFRFIHFNGAHVPLQYDKDVHVIGSDRGSYPQNMECSVTMVKAYLQKLKDAGVYDNTAIIVMGDHGYGFGHENGGLGGRTNALLAVKGIDEHHALSISEAPISYDDLQTCYQRLLSGAASDEVFDAQEGDQRERRCLLYSYLQENHMEEYIQTGYAWDMNTIRPTGNVYDR